MKSFASRVQAVVAMAVLSLFTMPAFAFTTPAAGSFGYDMYDITFNKMIGGPVGWVAAAFLAAFGISQVMKQWMITALCFLGVAMIIKMNTILTSLGALV